MQDKIVKILDPSFKTGTTEKNGKEFMWVLMKVQLESGKGATGFAPLAVGDIVEVTYNEKYKNYSVTKPKKTETTNPAQLDILSRLEAKIDAIALVVGAEVGNLDEDDVPFEQDSL